jgi:molybdenum cofactor biosynthesis protein B
MTHSAPLQARVAVLTVSDTRTPADDESGRICKEFVTAAGHEVVAYTIVRDEPVAVEAECRRLAPTVDVILLSGGTGIAPRDTTIEAVERLYHQRLDGFGELFRMLSFADIGSRALASRASAGVFGRTLLACMPGSAKAVRLAMEKLLGPEIGHLVGELKKS